MNFLLQKLFMTFLINKNSELSSFSKIVFFFMMFSFLFCCEMSMSRCVIIIVASGVTALSAEFADFLQSVVVENLDSATVDGENLFVGERRKSANGV